MQRWQAGNYAADWAGRAGAGDRRDPRRPGPRRPRGVRRRRVLPRHRGRRAVTPGDRPIIEAPYAAAFRLASSVTAGTHQQGHGAAVAGRLQGVRRQLVAGAPPERRHPAGHRRPGPLGPGRQQHGRHGRPVAHRWASSCGRERSTSRSSTATRHRSRCSRRTCGSSTCRRARWAWCARRPWRSPSRCSRRVRRSPSTTRPAARRPIPQLVAATTSVTVGPTAPNAVATARLWIVYRTGVAPSSIPTQTLTVQEAASGQTWQVTVDGNTVARATAATALVLDRSGSMSEDRGDGQTKHASLQQAANIFVDLMLEGDGVGIVRYNQDAQPLQPVLPLGPGGLSDVNRNATHDVINGNALDPAGCDVDRRRHLRGPALLDRGAAVRRQGAGRAHRRHREQPALDLRRRRADQRADVRGGPRPAAQHQRARAADGLRQQRRLPAGHRRDHRRQPVPAAEVLPADPGRHQQRRGGPRPRRRAAAGALCTASRSSSATPTPAWRWCCSRPDRTPSTSGCRPPTACWSSRGGHEPSRRCGTRPATGVAYYRIALPIQLRPAPLRPGRHLARAADDRAAADGADRRRRRRRRPVDPAGPPRRADRPAPHAAAVRVRAGVRRRRRAGEPARSSRRWPSTRRTRPARPAVQPGGARVLERVAARRGRAALVRAGRRGGSARHADPVRPAGRRRSVRLGGDHPPRRVDGDADARLPAGAGRVRGHASAPPRPGVYRVRVRARGRTRSGPAVHPGADRHGGGLARRRRPRLAGRHRPAGRSTRHCAGCCPAC